MIYKILSDFIIFIHFLWIFFIIGGFFLIVVGKLKNFWWRLVHLLGFSFVFILMILGKYCPLTIWENNLREKAGDATYIGSFIIHYIEKLIYPDVAPLLIQIPTAVLYVLTLFLFFKK